MLCPKTSGPRVHDGVNEIDPAVEVGRQNLDADPCDSSLQRIDGRDELPAPSSERSSRVTDVITT